MTDILLGDRFPEARPSGSRVELRSRLEQGRLTADAAEESTVVEVPIEPAEGSFGPAFPGDVIGERGKLSLPLVVRLHDLRHAVQAFAPPRVVEFDDLDVRFEGSFAPTRLQEDPRNGNHGRERDNTGGNEAPSGDVAHAS